MGFSGGLRCPGSQAVAESVCEAGGEWRSCRGAVLTGKLTGQPRGPPG